MAYNSYALVAQELRKAERYALEVRHGRVALYANAEA